MEFPDQRRYDVGRFQVEIIARAIHVGRHDGDEVRAVLLVVVPAQLDGRDLCHRVGLVRRLEQARQQILFFHGLGGELGIDAR